MNFKSLPVSIFVDPVFLERKMSFIEEQNKWGDTIYRCPECGGTSGSIGPITHRFVCSRISPDNLSQRDSETRVNAIKEFLDLEASRKFKSASKK